MRYNAAIEAAAARLAGLRPEEVCARTGAVFAEAGRSSGTRDTGAGAGRSSGTRGAGESVMVDAGTRDTGAGRSGEYLIPWFGEDRLLNSGSEIEQVLWYHYLTSEGAGALSGRLIAYRELQGAGFYEPSFNARAIRPLAKRFGYEPAAMIRAGAKLGAKEERTQGVYGMGDASVTLSPLPKLPVTYIIWAGDDELPPAGMILFDSTASGWLPAEDLTVLASLGAYKLIGAAG